MTALTQAAFYTLSAALLHFVWQGSLVAMLLWAALLGLRRRPAPWRYAASCVALAILAMLPAATVWILARRAAAAGPASAAPAYWFAATAAPSIGPAAVSWLVRVENWALPIWALGVLLLSLRLVWGARQVHGLRRRMEPAAEAVLAAVARLSVRMGIRQSVAVGVSPGAESPAVVGWIRPVILLPSASLLGLTPEQLEAVLAHELAHIRRFDYAVNLAQTVIETLLFYHPAVWWVSARMRHERELCCDDLAVAVCGDALCYARALTRLERLRLSAPQMAMASTGGPLLYRIQRLMGVAGPGYRASRLPAILTLCLGLACLAWNARWAKAQVQPPQQNLPTVTVTTKHGQTMTVRLNNSGKEDPPPGPEDIQMTADPGRVTTVTFQPRGEALRDRGVQVDAGGAKVLTREPVEYPGPAIERNIQGTVTVEAILDANGEVSDAHVLAGPQELRKAALRSVLGWRFQADPAGAGASRQVNITFQIPPGGFPKEPEGGERGFLFFRGDNAGLASESAALQAKQTTAFLQDEIARFRQEHQGTLDAGSSPELEMKYRELVLRLKAAEVAQKQLAEQAAKTDLADPSTLYGRTVKNIGFREFPEASQAALMSRLPIHIGDLLTPESVTRLENAVRQVSGNSAIGYTLTFDNQVEIHIGNPRQ